jgi:hypothetical protein
LGLASLRARTCAVDTEGCAVATEEIRGLQQILQINILKKVFIMGNEKGKMRKEKSLAVWG